MEFLIEDMHAGMRLDAAAALKLPEFSRAKIQKAIKDGHCLLDDKPVLNPALRVKSGQKIYIDIKLEPVRLQSGPTPLPVLWADAWLAVINKPAGLTVHPCPSCQEETVAGNLISLFPQLADQGGDRPGIVHRLDKDTSGIMLVALTEAERLKLAHAFAQRLIKKKYLALVAGIPPPYGNCNEPIGRHPQIKTRMTVLPESRGGKRASTSWRRLCSWQKENFSLLEVSIHTGRTHQIRVHLSHLGFPILGDTVYAPKNIEIMAKRQMLHAWKINLLHPETAEPLQFQAPLPHDFITTVINNMCNFKKIIVTGNPGCGKSTFCAMLASFGVPVISADTIVSELYRGKNEAAMWIESHMGEEILNKDFSVNKDKLFKEFIKRPWIREEFQKIIHDCVYEKINSFWQHCELNGKNAALAEIPLYFESDKRHYDKDAFIIGIKCDKAERWKRLKTTRGWDDSKIASIEQWQWPEERKMAACNLVVENTGSQQDLMKKAENFYQTLKNPSSGTDIKSALDNIINL